MSGAEPLAILGAVSSGLTLVKGTIEIIDRIISFNEGRKELPRAFGNLQAVLPLARISFERVRNRTLVIDDDKATSQMLEDVVNAFRRNMEELDKIFRKYLPRDDASWMRNAWTAIASFNQDERVHSLTTDIMRLVQVLSIHIEATSPTAEEITAVMAKEMNSQMDMKLQGVILDIQVSALNGHRLIIEVKIIELGEPWSTSSIVARSFFASHAANIVRKAETLHRQTYGLHC